MEENRSIVSISSLDRCCHFLSIHRTEKHMYFLSTDPFQLVLILSSWLIDSFCFALTNVHTIAVHQIGIFRYSLYPIIILITILEVAYTSTVVSSVRIIFVIFIVVVVINGRVLY